MKWHLLPKHIENRVDLYHDSDRDRVILKVNKYH